MKLLGGLLGNSLAANLAHGLCHPLAGAQKALQQGGQVQISIQLREVQT